MRRPYRFTAMLSLLKKHFGYDQFRPLQEDIINCVLAEKDTLVLMPTGGGKSLCFQLPALKFEGLTIVISPLISLMKDQVDALQANGIPAVFINSTLSGQEIGRIKNEALNGRIKILYVAPERFSLSSFRGFLKNLKLSLIAVDEAHCISEWGHDFRPDYRSLKELRNNFPHVPVMGLTATATKKVREDILEQLNLNDPQVFISSFDRPNLNYAVKPKRNSFETLLHLLLKHKGEPTIVYCFSRKNTEELSDGLRMEGLNVLPYHAGLDNETRKKTQDRFIRDEVSIIVATVAFGMGIDKPDVRLIVHYALPKSPEGYYQETGRAGRDGLPAQCVLFYSYGDRKKHDFFINRMQDTKERENAEKKLKSMIDFCELNTCRRKYLIQYFGEKWDKPHCGGCDICLTPREEFDATVISQKILSCVKRTGERFGGNHIIEVLLGKGTKKIRERGHDRLSVFGIVKDFNKEELWQIIGHLISRRSLIKNDDGFPTLSISEAGWAFLRQGENIELPRPKVEHGIAEARKTTESEYDPVLFEELRVLRKEMADEKGVPPFVIFGNTSLYDMAAYFPQSMEGFSQVSGVGAQKLAGFGESFLAVIRRYAQKHGIKELSRPGKKRALRQEGNKKSLKRGSTYYETKKLVEQKFPLRQIAINRGISEGTVLSHIEMIAGSEEYIDLEYLRPPLEELNKINGAFKQSNGFALKPVKETLGDEFSYDELRLARVFLMDSLTINST